MSDISSFERWWLCSWPRRVLVRKYVSFLLRSVPQPFRGEVLEVGAGYGWSSRRILETYPQVELTAIDTDPHATTTFAQLEERYGQRLKVREADVYHLPFDRASFDIVIVVHALRYLPDVSEAMRQMLRVTRPGGLIGIADSDQRYVAGPMKWIWRKPRRLTRLMVEQIAVNEGAEVVQATGGESYIVWIRNPYPLGKTD